MKLEESIFSALVESGRFFFFFFFFFFVEVVDTNYWTLLIENGLAVEAE